MTFNSSCFLSHCVNVVLKQNFVAFDAEVEEAKDVCGGGSGIPQGDHVMQ